MWKEHTQSHQKNLFKKKQLVVFSFFFLRKTHWMSWGWINWAEEKKVRLVFFFCFLERKKKLMWKVFSQVDIRTVGVNFFFSDIVSGKGKIWSQGKVWGMNTVDANKSTALVVSLQWWELILFGMTWRDKRVISSIGIVVVDIWCV